MDLRAAPSYREAERRDARRRTEATQRSRGAFSGGPAFSESDGIASTSGLIGGRVALHGPLSQDMLTIGIGIDVAPGTMHWHKERETGNVVVFFPGDELSALYTPGSLYATVNVTVERLEEEAAREDVIFDAAQIGGTDDGLRPRPARRIVERAREYIAAHLDAPMTVDEIAAAAFTSRRTLFRAFADLLDDTL